MFLSYSKMNPAERISGYLGGHFLINLSIQQSKLSIYEFSVSLFFFDSEMNPTELQLVFYFMIYFNSPCPSFGINCLQVRLWESYANIILVFKTPFLYVNFRWLCLLFLSKGSAFIQGTRSILFAKFQNYREA